MSEILEELLLDESDTVAAGAKIASLLDKGMTLYLEGQLGAGKTTLTRGVLSAMGHSGAVKSPTYTLVEPYDELPITTYHFDLYRLGDPEELAYLGIRDYFHQEALCIVEWPERGLGFLPEADIRLELHPQTLDAGSLGCDSGTVGRKLTITAATDKGKSVLAQW
ncbi:MAG: tRNA (adenosine(37)-N6)-threonylcarbamoyltransferase complex ATPase subunit type 1 TsaE [Cellvibrionaceae bacterium]